MGEIKYSRKISDGKLKRREQTLKTDVQKGGCLNTKRYFKDTDCHGTDCTDVAQDEVK